MRFFFISLIVCFLLSVATASFSEGFGNAHWGFTKKQTEDALSIHLTQKDGTHISAVFLYYDQIKSKSGHAIYSSKYVIFDREFDGLFVFSQKDELEQVFMIRKQQSNNVQTLMESGEMEKNFVRAFERATLKSTPKRKTHLDPRQYSYQEWLSKESVLRVVTEVSFGGGSYGYVIEASWMREASPF